MSQLFSPLRIRSIDFKNRIFVSPMCQYSSEDGMPQDWHFVHLGCRAVGGAALVMVEATAVLPEGRISSNDSGLWSDRHADAFQKITKFLEEHGSVPAIQLAHAGRKASTYSPWQGAGSLPETDPRAWKTLAPSAIPFASNYSTPKMMTTSDLETVVEAFIAGTLRAKKAGFKVVEIHMAHGYLLHEFLSPLSNRRNDNYGGSLDNRCRFPLTVAKAVRAAWPSELPLFVRISATDWMEGGWDLPQSLVFCEELKKIGIDLIDASSGGLAADAKIPLGPSYQVPFSKAIRQKTGLLTGAVGIITEPQQAENIIASGEADAVLLGREFLRDPYWPLHAAEALKAETPWPPQYLRAKRPT